MHERVVSTRSDTPQLMGAPIHQDLLGAPTQSNAEYVITQGDCVSKSKPSPDQFTMRAYSLLPVTSLTTATCQQVPISNRRPITRPLLSPQRPL